MTVSTRMAALLAEGVKPEPKLKDLRTELQAIVDLAKKKYAATINAKEKLSDTEKQRKIAAYHAGKVSISQSRYEGKIDCYRVTFDFYPSEEQAKALKDWAEKHGLRVSKDVDIIGTRWHPKWAYDVCVED